MPSIYISSTFRDLEIYRKEVFDTLTFLKDYFELVCPMEYMLPGSSEPVLQQCLKYVRAADIYVLIIGKRYGSVAPGTDKSFTEWEYDEAMTVPRKIVIPLVADETQEYLKDVEPDDINALNRFRTSVTTTHLTFVKNFSNPDHLSKQLLLALFRFADTRWGMKEEDDVRYYCNRTLQVIDFKGSKKQKKLNVFAIVCNKHDQADYFNNRMARYEFGFRKEYIDKTLQCNNIIGSSTDYNKHRQRFISSLMERFINPQDDMPGTLSECFSFLSRLNIHNVYIKFRLSKTETTNPTAVSSIVQFLNDLETECNKEGNTVTIFFTLTFEFGNDEAKNEAIVDCIPAGQGFKVTKLEPLERISIEDIRTWATTYVTKNDVDEIDPLLTQQFPDEEKTYTMYELFPLLRNVLETL